MGNQEEEIKARDEDAESYERWYLQKGYYYDWVEKKTIINALNIQKEDTVLDAGCGTGRLTREIAKKCGKVYGIDFSPRSIELLNKRAQEEGIKNIEAYVGDITNLLPVKERVDKIVSVQVIQHIPTDTKRHQALENLYAQLKPGGISVLSLYNARPILGAGLAKEGQFTGGIYYYRFTPSEAETLMRESGFRQISVRGAVNFRLYGIVKNRWLSHLFYPVAVLDLFLSRFKFSCLLGSFLICRGFR